MDEVVLSTSCSEEDMVVELGKDQKIEKKDDDGSSEVVRWEKFLPRMVLRVLLVEADDSTRQIIAALLRKCSYRVAAVPDGLMAWETLKDKPHEIDLILTEVELPSISGYALLTLVMEHDVCKNIPVIMMSSHDSISMVLKCMLKGAADFLIKPVRRNELRNLWQHVWRRQTLTTGQSSGNSPKVEASSENNAASNHSSDCAVSSQKNKDCSETGSDSHGFSQLKHRSASNLRNTNGEKFEECAKLDKSTVTSEVKTGGRSNGLRPEEELYHQASNPTVLRLGEERTCAKTVTHDESSRQENEGDDANIPHRQDAEPCGAIDLIGSFKNDHKCTYGHTNLNDGMSRFDFTPQLELSLRRLNPSSSNNHGIDEKHALNHSNASAFSWYNSKTLQALFPTSTSNGTEFKEEASKSQELSSNQNTQNISGVSQSHGATVSGSQEIMTTLVIGQSGKAELAYTSPQLGLIPVPGIRLNHISTGYSQAVPPVCYAQSSAAWSTKAAGPREQSPFPTSTSVHSNPEVHDSKQSRRCSDEIAYNSVDQNMHQQNKMEHIDELRHDSPVAGPTSSGSLCNGVANHNNSSTYGSFCSGNDGNALTSVASEKAMAPDSLNDGSPFNNEGFRRMDSHRSNQREAALTKFRLKRKDRCYEKKVRYQSRKRLAEQRPRVKGQFVRQVQNDVPVADATS